MDPAILIETAPQAPARARVDRPTVAMSSGQARPTAKPQGDAASNLLSVQELSTDQGPVAVVADEVLVALRPGVGAEGFNELAARLGLRVRSLSSTLGMGRLAIPDGQDLQGAIALLQRQPEVADARGNALMQGAGTVPVTLDGTVHLLAPNTASKRIELVAPNRTRHEATLRDLQWNLRQLNVPATMDTGLGGEAMTVAILDSGIAYENYVDASGVYAVAPDLAHVTFVTPRDVVNGDDHANDDHGHGTEMASLMAGIGATYPIAPNLNIMPVKVLDSTNSGTEAWLVEGIAWAIDHGADVINMSLVFPQAYRPSPILQAAIAAADEAGIVVVAATGNSGGSFVPFPAAFQSVIAVGAYRATDLSSDLASAGVRAAYSNASALVDVLAPGGSTSHDLDGNGHPDTLVAQSFAPGNPTQFGYYLVTGTSQASAQASAVAALLLAAGDSADDVRTRFHQTANKGGVSGGFDANAGSGRLDAGAAVTGALTADISAACRDARVYANPVGAIVQPAANRRMARFQVEIVGPNLEPMAGATVHARIAGSSNHQLTGLTDRNGVVTFSSAQVVASSAAGVNWSLEVEAVFAEQGGCAKGERVLRPAIFSRVEELSFQFLSSIGAGMASSSFVALLDPTAAVTLQNVTLQNYQTTYMQRTFGAGMASSSLVAIFDYSFLLANASFQNTMVLRTFGSGMASSSIILDQTYFNPTLLGRYNTSFIAAMAYTAGQGMASSSLIVDGYRLAWDAYIPSQTSMRGVLWLTNGSGMASSSLVLDMGVLNPSLMLTNTANLRGQLDARTVTATTIGTSQSAALMPLNSSVASQLGYDAGQLAAVQVRTNAPTNGTTAPRWAVGSPYGSGALIASAAATRFGADSGASPASTRALLD
ncbi:MAG: S8 family serine peptidase [Myxococcota bacterium]